MSRYTVMWNRDLESDFINIWLASDSSIRSALTRASDWIDQKLALDPESQGRPLEETAYRILIVPGTEPLRVEVVYEVIPLDRQVRIVNIRFGM